MTLEAVRQNGEGHEAVESQVRIRLCATGDANRETLESGAFAVLEAVEKFAAAIALGPVVACDFEASEIELEFTVEGQGSQLHACIGEVLSVIERELPIARERSSETASAELACA